MTDRNGARAWAPGTCGDLVEGTWEGKPFLVTCPIDLGSTMEVYLDGEKEVPKSLNKTGRALDLVKKKLNLPDLGLGFVRESKLPPGKGMGSSTSDIAAAILAAARLFEREISAEEIARLALSIEPSDGIMFRCGALRSPRRALAGKTGGPASFQHLGLGPGGSGGYPGI